MNDQAYSLNERCIVNALQSSGKKHLLLIKDELLKEDSMSSGGVPAVSHLRELLHDHTGLLTIMDRQEYLHCDEPFSGRDVFKIDLDDPFGNVGCVIMASGLGKRFGSNKLLACFAGKQLFTYSMELTNTVFRRRIVVTRHEEIRRWCIERNIPVIMHNLPFRSDTIRLGTERLRDCRRIVFCPADQPLLHSDTVKSLLLCAADEPERIWRVSDAEKPGAPVVFPQWTFDRLCSLKENQGGSAVIRAYPEQERTVQVFRREELIDIDTPQILQELERKL